MKQFRIWRNLVAFAVISFLSQGALAADDTKGFLKGQVESSSGQGIEGATITIVHEQQGSVRTILTDEKGGFKFPALTSGQYTVTASKEGYNTARQENINVVIGSNTIFNVQLNVGSIEEIVVTGSLAAVDTSTSANDFIVDASTLSSQIPMPRTQAGLSLLAPTANVVDKSFQAPGAVSLAGSSAAENACFMNGLNITNFRTGVGCSVVPFEFFDIVEVKEGGYQAEYGRSIGGVINAIAKSGSNEFKGGAAVYYSPNDLRETAPSNQDFINELDTEDDLEALVYASGPIIEDKAFFYVLYQPQRNSELDVRTDVAYDYQRNHEFWGAKIDINITDTQKLEYTGFSDKREIERDSRDVTQSTNSSLDAQNFGAFDYRVGSATATAFLSRGGENHSFKYTGVWNDWLTTNVQYGINNYDRTDASNKDNNPAIYDFRSGSAQQIGNFGSFSLSDAKDRREAFRLDVDMYLGDHSIRFGIDREENTAEDLTTNSGGVYYSYWLAGATNKYVGLGLIPQGTEYLRVRDYSVGGKFETLGSAIYIQDTWELGDLTLNLGLRNETFDNRNAEGVSFVKIDNQIAPRLGFAWDVDGDGSSKLYGNLGRYFLPVAANTNIRMAGNETYIQNYYLFNSINADDTPNFDPNTLFYTDQFATGEVPDAASIKDANIEPMYQDELILGYQFELEDWKLGLEYTRRDLGVTIEDVAIDAAVANRFGSACTYCTGFHWYVLTNPGTDMEVTIDIDESGPLAPQTVKFSAEELGYPKSERYYEGYKFTFERSFDQRWFLKGSYLNSHSWGNNEGFVRSDNGQDDAGLTTLFDQPGLMSGAYGSLPNDRPHNLKVFGAYKLDSGVLFGANFLARSGRPLNAFGVNPDDPFAAAYGAASFYNQGQLVERGSVGRTPDIYQLDLAASYTTSLGEGNLTTALDIFNVFNFRDAIELVETADLGSGDVNSDYLAPLYYQTPRYMQFRIRYDF